jgi:capsular polysaccharide biosynthesis protein
MTEECFYNSVCLSPAYKDESVNIPIRLGAFSADGQPLGHFFHKRRVLHSSSPDFLPSEKKLDGEYIYGGLIFDHYGHFITESLARFWYIRKHKGLPIVWHRLNKRMEFSGWQKEIFQIIGLSDRTHLIVDRPISLERVRLADPGFVLFGYAVHEQVNALGVYHRKLEKDIDRLWLSRAKVTDRGAIHNEQEFEDYLYQRGWTIIIPEEHSVRTQMDYFLRSRIVAGIAGSAFHTLMLMRNIDCSVRIVDRFSHQITNYNFVSNIRNFNQKNRDGLLDIVSGVGGEANYRIRSFDEVHDFISA